LYLYDQLELRGGFRQPPDSISVPAKSPYCHVPARDVAIRETATDSGPMLIINIDFLVGNAMGQTQ
jgi:hypothetical protein